MTVFFQVHCYNWVFMVWYLLSYKNEKKIRKMSTTGGQNQHSPILRNTTVSLKKQIN